eukprot:7146566-Prymnesium_polylepis.2
MPDALPPQLWDETAAAHVDRRVVGQVGGELAKDAPAVDPATDQEVIAAPAVVGPLPVGRERARKVGLREDGDRVEQTCVAQLLDERGERVVHVVEVGVEGRAQILVRVEPA